MICPEGYVSLASLMPKARDALFDDAFESVSEHCNGAENKEDAELRFLKESPMDIVEWKMLGVLSERLYLTSPDRKIQKFDIIAILESERLPGLNGNELDRLWNTEEHADLYLQINRFVSSLELFDENLDVFFADYTKSGEKNLWDYAKDKGLAGAHLNAPLFYERHGYSITLAFFDFLEPFFKSEEYFEAIDFTDFSRVLRPFAGWVMCVTAQDAKMWAARIAKQKRDKILGLEGVAHNKKTGRPRKQEFARAAYEILFPDGHGRLSMPEVNRKLERDKGVVVSIPTLTRALKEKK